MKKTLSFLLIVCLLICLFAGCQNQAEEPIDEPDNPIVDPTQPEEPDKPKEPNPKYDLCDSSEFLMFKPVVSVRDGEYEIWITAQYSGIYSIVIGDESYTATDDIADDGWNFFKCRIPQEKLDKTKIYAICRTESENAKPKGVEFEFKPIEKTENINIYVSSDVHNKFNGTMKEYEYLGDDLDLIVCNGDFVSQIPNDYDVFKIIWFYGELSQGRYPLVTARGNHEYVEADREHDRQGSEGSPQGYKAYNKYIAENGHDYYEFSVGPINGIVLDMFEGLDSVTFPGDDYSPFIARMQEQTEFIRNTTLDNDKINIVISHVCPVNGGWFDSVAEEAEKWPELLNDLGLEFMICGHYHGNFIYQPNDERSSGPNNYPVIFGCTPIDIYDHCGIALTVYKDKVDVAYVHSNLSILDTATVDYPKH